MESRTEPSLEAGLSSGEALSRLGESGPNLFWPQRRFGLLSILGRVLMEPTLAVLLVVLLLYVLMGSGQDAVLLSFFVVLVTLITFFEEWRTQRSLDSLKAFASPRVLVRRDGRWQRLPGVEVVPGDVVLLREGDRVAADCRLEEAHDLQLDESILTGESFSAWKTVESGTSMEDRGVFGGSLVVKGQAVARVLKTGQSTRIGGISSAAAGLKSSQTPFQASVARLVRNLAWIAFFSCILVVAVAMARGMAFYGAVVQGLTLAIATVPEEMPVVLTVFLALAARRLARKQVLAQRIPAVESLGSITLLAVDKTGTLTSNEMKLAVLRPGAGIPEADLTRSAAEACEPDPFDPMEREILARSGVPAGKLTFEYPLSGMPPRMGHVWDGVRLSVKGAVDGVLSHCAITEPVREAIRAEEAGLAARGMRVLAVARGVLDGAPPAALPSGLEYLGLLAFEDPIRPGTKEALDQCRRAGIRVVMMTGDSGETAAAVARQLDLDERGGVRLGRELEAGEARAAQLSKEGDLFARMAPEHKLLLIKAWTSQGHVVGMTGDGVNDAPALAQAHVGIAMGNRGSDVAREAADIVLADDSFVSLVEGVRLGRGATDRILKASLFILAVHVPIVGLVLICALTGLPPLITAAQVAFLELFIGPACSVAFERSLQGEDPMARPPRDPRKALTERSSTLMALLQGGLIMLAVLGQYLFALRHGAPVEESRTASFFCLMFADLMLCWVHLSNRPFWDLSRWANPAYWLISGGVMGLLTLLLWLPRTSSMLHMVWLPPAALLPAAALAAMAVLWYEFPRMFKASDRVPA